MQQCDTARWPGAPCDAATSARPAAAQRDVDPPREQYRPPPAVAGSLTSPEADDLPLSMLGKASVNPAGWRSPSDAAPTGAGIGWWFSDPRGRARVESCAN